MITLIAGKVITCLYLNMAELIPFPSKSELPSKCSSSGRCSEKLPCPACSYVACSSGELHAHVAQMHAPAPIKSKTLHFGRRPTLVEDLQ